VGEGNLNKWFVGIFVFIGIFGTLLSTVPTIFQAIQSITTVQEKETIEVFTAYNITVYNNTLTIWLDYGSENFTDFGLPSPQRLHFWWSMAGYYNVMGITHQKNYWLGYWYDTERLEVQEPYTSQMEFPLLPEVLTEQDVVTNLFDTTENTTIVHMETPSGSVSLNLIIAPRDISQTMQQAWDTGELVLYTSYTIDFAETGASMWNIMFQLLAFQTPALGIGGTWGTVLTRALSLTLWAMIGVLAFALATSIIPTISGWR